MRLSYRVTLPSLLVLAAALALSACRGEVDAGTATGAGTVRESDLSRVTFGQTTPGDVEGMLGAPATRNTDGSMVYEMGSKSHHESVTFRFRDGVLARVCRDRS